MAILDKTQRKTISPSSLDTQGWSELPLAYRERAFFSAKVENAQFLQRAKNLITQYQSNERDPEHGGMTSQGRSQFINELKEFCYQEGIGRADSNGKLLPLNDNDLKDIRSTRRLGLIYDTQTEQANAYEDWKNGQDDVLLQWYPAQRFIRVRHSAAPRPIHAANEGAVRLKNDTKFWTSMNPDFGVPWGPWGFNSGMGVEDVDRAEALALGLIKDGDILEPDTKNFNENLAASIEDLDPDMSDWLLDSLDGQGSIIDNKIFFKSLENKQNLIPDTRPLPIANPSNTAPASLENIDAKLEKLTQQYRAASNNKQRLALIKRALASLSYPKSQRGELNLLRDAGLLNIPSIDVAKAAITRLVHPTLIPPHIKILTAEDRRAYSKNDAIYISPSSSHLTIAHEMMHQIERNPKTKTLEKSAEFLFSRARIIDGKMELPQSLRRLTGENYHPSEYTIEDNFKLRKGEHYAGKLYLNKVMTEKADSTQWHQEVYNKMNMRQLKKAVSSTEILSSGIERLISNPILFRAQDPEYFNFIIKTLRKIQ